MDKYRVTLTAEERADLGRLVSSGKAAARKLTHARILLLADTSSGKPHTDAQIVASLSIGSCCCRAGIVCSAGLCSRVCAVGRSYTGRVDAAAGTSNSICGYSQFHRILINDQ